MLKNLAFIIKTTQDFIRTNEDTPPECDIDPLLVVQVQDLRNLLISKDLPERPDTAVEVQVDEYSS